MVKQGGTLKGTRTAILVPRHMAVTITNVTAVQNQWYPILTAQNVAVLSVQIRMSTAAEDLELDIVADGVTHAGAQGGAVAGTWYFPHLNPDVDNLLFGGGSTCIWDFNGMLAFHARTIVIRMRKTSAAGANVLGARVHYEQY